MAHYGYARVSTTDQDLSIQETSLKQAGCDIIRMEKVSGTSRQGRDELDILLQFIRSGDTLVVTRIDRLARSLKDLCEIVDTLLEKGAALKATEQPIDTSSPAGKAFLGMLGVFAEFETNIRLERQREGIAKAKAEGRYAGRKATAMEKAPEVIKLLDTNMTKQAIADQVGIGVSSVYRIMRQHKAQTA